MFTLYSFCVIMVLINTKYVQNEFKEVSMKIAVIGSRTLNIENIASYIPAYCDEIVTGGARGVDKNAEEYAIRSGIKLTLFLPEYSKFGKSAPLKRNQKIVEYADELIAFWDGRSRGTLYTINAFKALNKKSTVIIMENSN